MRQSNEVSSDKRKAAGRVALSAGGHADLADPSLTRELGAILTSRGYTAQGVASVLGASVAVSPHAAAYAGQLLRLPTDSHLSTLIKLLLFGLDVSVAEASRALLPLRPDQLHTLGVMRPVGSDRQRSKIRIIPHQDLLIACDHAAETGSRPDHVPGVHASSMLLANLTPRQPSSSVLDVGTGCGVQALLASRHSERVVAVDVNPRAVSFTAFNAALNGISNVETRTGDLFGPVAGQSFDLIVCNPPYVIAPEPVHTYRDSSLPGDHLCQQIVAEAPKFLRPGGFACILVSWLIRPGEPWQAALERWVQDSGCDALLLGLETVDLVTNASRWATIPEGTPLELRQQELHRWVRNLHALGGELVGYGTVVLSPSDGRTPWILSEQLSRGPAGPAGAQVVRMFEGGRILNELQDDALMNSCPILAQDQRMEQVLRLRDGAWQPVASSVVAEGGLELRMNADPLVAGLLAGLDEGRSLQVVFADLPIVTRAGGLELEALRQRAIEMVRHLVIRGVVVLQ